MAFSYGYSLLNGHLSTPEVEPSAISPNATLMWFRLTVLIVMESMNPLAFVCARAATIFLELES